MFPFSINNTLKLFANNSNNSNLMDSIDEDAIKERISQAVLQSLPNKRNIKFNAIIVLECDSDNKRTIVINENINNTGQKVQLTATFPGNSFTTISTSNITNQGNVLLAQQPMFPATVEGLQAILNLASSTMNKSNMADNIIYNNNHNDNGNNNSFSFIPMQLETVETVVKTEKGGESTDTGVSSRKRKSEKPCRIPPDSIADSNGLDLTLGGRYEGSVKQEKVCGQGGNGMSIWPSPMIMESHSLTVPNQPIIISRAKKSAPLGQGAQHKKSSKVFNCNQCKLQFSSLNSLCKHTFSDHRAFRCTFCSANFTQRSNLQRHSLKHVGFKPFICNVCTKAYYRKDHLVRHIEVSHPGSEPKANITVKLSSSECLEFLERMQSEKLREMSALEGGDDGSTLSDTVCAIDGGLEPVGPVLDESRDNEPISDEYIESRDNGSIRDEYMESRDNGLIRDEYIQSRFCSHDQECITHEKHEYHCPMVAESLIK